MVLTTFLTINCWFSCKRDIDELANNNKMKKAKSCVAVVTHQSSQYFFFLHRNFYVFWPVSHCSLVSNQQQWSLHTLEQTNNRKYTSLILQRAKENKNRNESINGLAISNEMCVMPYLCITQHTRIQANECLRKFTTSYQESVFTQSPLRLHITECRPH